METPVTTGGMRQYKSSPAPPSTAPEVQAVDGGVQTQTTPVQPDLSWAAEDTGTTEQNQSPDLSWAKADTGDTEQPTQQNQSPDLSWAKAEQDKERQVNKEDTKEESFGVLDHLAEIPAQAVKGVVDAFDSTVDAYQDLAEVFNPGFKATSTLASMALVALHKQGVGEGGLLQKGIADGSFNPRLPKAETVTGEVVNDISQFLTGLFGATKIIKGAGWVAQGAKTVVARTAIASGASESAAFEINEQGLTEMLNQYPMFEPFMPDFMDRSEEAGVGEIRLKKFIDGIGWGVLGDSLFLGLKAYKMARAGKAEEALKHAEEAEAVLKDTADAVEPPKKAEPDAPPDEKVAGDVTVEEPVFVRKTVVGPKRLAKMRAAIQEAKSAEEIEAIVTGTDFNFSNMESTNDVKQLINSISEVIASQIDKLKGGVQSLDETKRLADLLGTDEAKLVQDIQSTHGNTANLAATATAGRILIQKMGTDVSRLATIVADPKVATAVHKAEFIEKMQLMSEVVALQKGMQTNIARALSSHRIKVGDTFKDLTAEELETIIKQAGGDAKLAEFASNYALNAGNARKQVQQLEKGFSVGKLIDVHNEYWINSILSGFTTHTVNLTSALAQSLILPAQRVVGAAVLGNKEGVREGVDHFLAMFQSSIEALRLAGATMKKGENMLDSKADLGSRVETNTHAISSRNFDIRQNTLAGKIIDGVGSIVRIPSRFLLSEDEFFKQLTYRSRVRTKAWTEARQQGLNTKEKASLVERRLIESLDENGGALDKDSLQWARETTFTQDLEYGLGKDWQTMVLKHPALRVVTPFVRTPTNLMRSAWQNTPGLQFFQKQLMADLASTGARRQLAVGKIATSNAIGLAIGGMAMSGYLTGKSPLDDISGGSPLKKGERDALLATGWQPYSFVIKNEDGTAAYVPFGRLDPYGMLLGIVADTNSMSKDLNDDEMGDILLAVGAAVARNVTSKTYLSGITNILEVLTSGSPDMVGRYLRNQVASYVPNALNQSNGDPLLREARTVADAIMSKIPMRSQGLMPKRTVLGEPIKRTKHALPWQVSEERDEPVYKELAALGGPLAHPPKKLKMIDLTTFVNKDGQDAYDRYLELQATIVIGGHTLKQKLKRVMGKSSYGRLPNDTGDFMSEKAKRLRAVIQRYRDKAERELKKEAFNKKDSSLSIKQAFDNSRENKRNVPRKGIDSLLDS